MLHRFFAASSIMSVEIKTLGMKSVHKKSLNAQDTFQLRSIPGLIATVE